MSWIAEYDTQGREFPTCVHVTKTTNTMTHGATYVPIEEGKAVREENAKLRELLSESLMDYKLYAEKYGLPPYISDVNEHLDARMRELGIEVSNG